MWGKRQNFVGDYWGVPHQRLDCPRQLQIAGFVSPPDHLESALIGSSGGGQKQGIRTDGIVVAVVIEVAKEHWGSTAVEKG